MSPPMTVDTSDPTYLIFFLSAGFAIACGFYCILSGTCELLIPPPHLSLKPFASHPQISKINGFLSIYIVIKQNYTL